MVSNNVLIGWPNRAPGGVFSGGSWQPTLPLSNLKNNDYWECARSRNAALTSTQFEIDLGGERNLRCIALPRHNLSRDALWRVQLGTQQRLADRFDSMWLPAWRLAFDGDLLEWESNSFWEGVMDDPYAYVGSQFAAVLVLPDWINARYVRIQIDDHNNPQRFVQLGQLFVGGGFQPKWNASYGLQDGWVDKTQVAPAGYGSVFSDQRERYRQTRFVLEHLSPTEKAVVYEMQRRQGIAGDVFYAPYPNNQVETQRYGFLGRLEELSPIEYPRFNTHSSAWAITES